MRRLPRSVVKEILTHRIDTCKRIRQRAKILRKVLRSDVLVIPFDRTYHYTYKNHKEIVLHYPLKKFLHSLMIKHVLKPNLPYLGFIVLNTVTGSNVIPFAEIVIENIILPEEIEPYWTAILHEKSINPDKTINQIYHEKISSQLINERLYLQNSFETFLSQRGYDDERILQVIKPKNGGLNSNDSSLLWLFCTVIEYFTASHLNINQQHILVKDYLFDGKLGQHSVAFGLSKEKYFVFRKGLKNVSDYEVGENALKKAFIHFDEIGKSDVNYSIRYKVFSENAWRDLLCTYQLNYTDNQYHVYNMLFHLIWEMKNTKEYKLVDFDTDVRCINVDNKTQNALDAFIHFQYASTGQAVKLYIELKNFNKTINDERKDYYTQPRAILHNSFLSTRYFHYEGDEWYYVAVSKDSPYYTPSRSVSLSGISERNYINFTWSELFKIIDTQLYPKAVTSIDKKLFIFMNFLERV